MTAPSAEQAAELQRRTAETILAAVDAGAISFAEIGLAARYASTVRLGGTLSTDEARAAWRILSRNEASLARVGLALPQVAREATAPASPAHSDVQAVVRPTLAMRSDGRIGITHSPYALKDALAAQAHARWDKPRKQWHVPATAAGAAAAMEVLAAHDPVCSAHVAALLEEHAGWAAARAGLAPDAPLPQFDAGGLVKANLWTHQRRAVEFATRLSACLLAVPMGGGKTAAAIAAVNRRPGLQRVVIVCPNKVRGVWPREISRWSAQHWHIVDGKRPSRRRGAPPQDLPMAARLEQAERCLFDCACGARVHAVVFNYEALLHAPISSWVPSEILDVVIYDEVHRLKSSKQTGVSAKASEWVGFFHKRIGLTGTPMPQYPWDIFGVYRALEPGIFGTFWTPFRGRYVQMRARKEDGREFPVAIEKSESAEFNRRVHSIMYRPEIDLQLPGASHVVRTVEFEPSARAEYNRLRADLWADLSQFDRSDHATRSDVDPTLTPKNVLARSVRERQFCGGTAVDDGEVTEDGKIVRNRYRVSTAKSDTLAEVLAEVGCVSDHSGGPEPVCVYCEFRDDLDRVQEVAQAAGLRYREISGRRADGLTRAAEMAPDADVVGVQTASGGTGVDLTRSRFGIWYSPPYSASNYDQALKRQDRPGQTRPVLFVHLPVRDSADEDVYRSLAQRKGVTETFLAARGVNPAVVGLSPDDAADASMSMEDVAETFNAQREAQAHPEDVERGGGGVVLPIDDFPHDVLGDPRAHQRKAASRQAVTDAELREYGLDGFA